MQVVRHFHRFFKRKPFTLHPSPFTLILILWSVAAALSGCQVQVGGEGNRQTMGRKVQVTRTYHDRLVSGDVSILESIERAHARKAVAQ